VLKLSANASGKIQNGRKSTGLENKTKRQKHAKTAYVNSGSVRLRLPSWKRSHITGIKNTADVINPAIIRAPVGEDASVAGKNANFDRGPYTLGIIGPSSMLYMG
jgi:hypothetical protein